MDTRLINDAAEIFDARKEAWGDECVGVLTLAKTAQLRPKQHVAEMVDGLDRGDVTDEDEHHQVGGAP